MNDIVITARVESADIEPLCFVERLGVGKVSFSRYPLSLFSFEMDGESVSVNGVRYPLDSLPVTVRAKGAHVTKYRETVEEHITLTITVGGC